MNYKKYEYVFDPEKYCPWVDGCKKRERGECIRGGCFKYSNYYYMFGNSLLPEKYRVPKPFLTNEEHVDHNAHLRLAEIKEDMIGFVQNGGNLIIMSKHCGCGKTHFAVRMLLKYFYERLKYANFEPKGLFIDVSRLFAELKMSYVGKSDYLEFVMENIDADLIIWDDICSEEMTPQQYTFLFALINRRDLAGLANIYTANGDEQDLYQKLGEKLFSRIYVQSEKIVFNGGDYRNVIAQNNLTMVEKVKNKVDNSKVDNAKIDNTTIENTVKIDNNIKNLNSEE